MALRSRAADLRPARPRGEILDEEERIRIDTCFGCGHHLVDTDAPRGVYFSVVSLVKALRARDPERMALSLCVVGGSISVVGGRLLGHIGERMMRQADAIAARLDSPDVWGTIDISRGQVLMLAGRCGKALTGSDDGVKRLTEECQGHALECNVGRIMRAARARGAGPHGKGRTQGQELRDAAATVGDRYAETAASQVLAIARIACDDVAGARELARHGLELWTRRDFHIQHFYCGAHPDTLRPLRGPSQGWLGTPAGGGAGAAALRAAADRAHADRRAEPARPAGARLGEPPIGGARQTPSRLRAHRARARKGKRADAALHAHLLRGGIAALRGEDERAVAHLEGAIRIGGRMR